MLGLGTSAGCAFPHQGFQRSLSGLHAHPLGPGLEPLEKDASLSGHLPEGPVKDALLKAAEGCPGAPSGGDQSHGEGPNAIGWRLTGQDTSQGTTGYKQWNGRISRPVPTLQHSCASHLFSMSLSFPVCKKGLLRSLPGPEGLS